MRKLTTSALLFALFTTSAAQAHDPSMHKEKVEKPDCAAMKGMDHSKMDANDPVMQAMMKKCAEQMQHGDHSAHGEGHNAAQEPQEK